MSESGTSGESGNSATGDVNPSNTSKGQASGNFNPADFIPKRVFNEKNEQLKTTLEALNAAAERASQAAAKVEQLQIERDKLFQQNSRIHKEYKVREALLQEGAYDPTDVIPLVDLDKVEADKLGDVVKSLKEQKSYLFKKQNSAPTAHKPTNGGDPYGFAAMSEKQITEQFVRLSGDERKKFKAEYDAYRKGH